jgi:hypothetical protein
VADRDGDGHADRTWAGFLGIAAADVGADDYAYTPAAGAVDRAHAAGRMAMTAPADFMDDRLGDGWRGGGWAGGGALSADDFKGAW